MKLKTKRLRASLSRKIVASLVAGGLICTGSFAFAADDSNNVVTADENSVTRNGETTEDSGTRNRIDGGQTTDGNANKNKVTINGGTIDEFLNGGYVFGYGNTNNNLVLINEGTFNRWIEGGWATYGDANYNILTINGGTFNKAVVDGGYTEVGNTNNNAVNIFGGTFDVIGKTSDNNFDAGIYGGYVAKSGNAVGNTINIHGGTINGYILGGYTENGEVRDNVINIHGGDLTNANIYAAKVGDNYPTDQNWGNALNFYTKGITAKQVGGFDTLRFVLPRDITNGDTILTLTDSAGTQLDRTKIYMSTQGNTNLNVGDAFTLVQNTGGNGMSFDMAAINEANPNPLIGYGIAWDNYATFEGDSQEGLRVRVGERVEPLKEQIEALTEGMNNAKNMIDSGTNRILDWLPPEEIEMRGIDEPTQFEPFMGTGGGVMRVDTGHGTKLKNKNGGTNIGYARALPYRSGILIFAPIVDYGAATYTTSLANGTDGGGNSQYFTAGLIARYWNKKGQQDPGGMYYELSFRAGRMKTGFVTDEFTSGNEEKIHTSYTDHAPTYAGHARIGWRSYVSEQNVMDIYGIYSQNHVGEFNANMSNVNQTYRIESSDSKWIRLGARLTREINDHNRFYSGLAYQYEFGGETLASFMNESTRKVGLKGSSGMLELGWQLKPTPNSAVMLDSGLVGWVGKQKGISFQCKLKKEF